MGHHRVRLFGFVVSAAGVAAGLLIAATTASNDALSETCQPAGALVRVPALPEASGLAASRRTPGRLWSHNDSGTPVLVGLDARGTVTGQVRLTGATLDDWEAVAVGACPAGTCLYLGDIGDNDARRSRIAVHRLAEPADDGTAAITETFYAAYPDRPHDAETLLVAPDGRVHVVTKGDTGPIALYRFPVVLTPGATHRLERVAAPAGSTSRVPAAQRITDGAVSPDGVWVVLRTHRDLAFHRAADLFAGTWTAATRVDIGSLAEPQGEGVAFGSEGIVYLAGEGGGHDRPGTIAIVRCTLPTGAARAAARE